MSNILQKLIGKLKKQRKKTCLMKTIIGFKIKVDVKVIKERTHEIFPNVPRFSSLMVKDDKHGKMTWVPTTINIDDHIICPDLEYDDDQENVSLGDEIVDEYMARLTSKPMDLNKPLWEVHILNMKTSSANATALFLIHHSIGDGISLVSVLLAMTRKTSDPESLPTIPTGNVSEVTLNKDGNSISGKIEGLFSKTWKVLLMIFYTCYDVALFLATLFFLKDTKSPIKGGPGIEETQKRVFHRDVSLDDLKLVKTATNATINDVVVGITQAGLSRYLNRRYGKFGKMKTIYVTL
ncbi:acyltransferase [Lithospermum erythrorhizon]|uniref:diacylglycerol O-acyltransferase n=1 Tax=Lithospermum erythrorhizon TaxID=34254 RepID=A0AAV3P7X2_LITER